MYLPRHFEETRLPVLHDLIRAQPLATLVTLASSGLTANHIPLILDADAGPNGTLRGHVARANPLWRDFSAEAGALDVFHGPEAYITPSWYAEKPRSGKVVPTWNYAVVHASGPLVVIDDAAWVRALVERLTRQMETPRPQPWSVADAPSEYIDAQVSAIVGLEIPITRICGKWKLSQNRTAEDREGVAHGLADSDDPMASWIG